MKITSAEFIKSVYNIAQLPQPRLPEVAFAGRSNVGKSSLLNALTNRKKLAAISSTPGKTKSLNYFRINQKYYFVDLPGYGYAKVSQQTRKQWRNLIEAYLNDSQELRCVVVIIDARHEVTNLDLQMLKWLSARQIPPIVVATKVDKLSSNALTFQLSKKVAVLADYAVDFVYPFSAITGYGRKQILHAIYDKLNLIC